jgi:hypothetical protein
MFKVICRCNRTIERHTNSPLADPRRRDLEHLAAGRKRVIYLALELDRSWTETTSGCTNMSS